jgi:hypothetical protein
VRVLADTLGIETIDRDATLVVFKFREKAKVDPARVITLIRERPELQLVPPATLKLRLGAAPDGRKPRRQPAWWTARATSEVMPGFTKAELTKAAPVDPRSEGGLLEQVTGVLLALAGER